MPRMQPYLQALILKTNELSSCFGCYFDFWYSSVDIELGDLARNIKKEVCGVIDIFSSSSWQNMMTLEKKMVFQDIIVDYLIFLDWWNVHFD
jgi:hypothetical protein